MLTIKQNRALIASPHFFVGQAFRRALIPIEIDRGECSCHANVFPLYSFACSLGERPVDRRGKEKGKCQRVVRNVLIKLFIFIIR